MKYNFDKVVNRKGTHALSVEGFREYLFGEYQQLELPFTDDELIHMWVADMLFETAPEIIDALKKRLDHGILGYSFVSDNQFSKAFTAWTSSRYQWQCHPEHMVTTQGVVPALYDMVGQLCNPGDKVLILTPSYAFFKHAADYNGIELVTSDLILKNGRYVMDFEDIETKARDEKVTLSIFCSPHNPTGRLWDAEELRQFGSICLKNGLNIISDEVHCDLLRRGKTFTPLAKLFPDSDQIITCMSASKAFNLAGLMFATMIIPNEAERNAWNKTHLPVVNPLSLIATQAAYTSGQAWLNELTDYLDDNFDFLDKYLAQHLPKVVFRVPESTYLAWIDVSAYFPDEMDLTYFFARHAGVMLEGGKMFVANADGYIRLNIACPKSILEAGLNRIVQAVLAYGVPAV